jgi:hypothetical protein
LDYNINDYKYSYSIETELKKGEINLVLMPLYQDGRKDLRERELKR